MENKELEIAYFKHKHQISGDETYGIIFDI